jgi:hypothetical protein
LACHLGDFGSKPKQCVHLLFHLQAHLLSLGIESQLHLLLHHQGCISSQSICCHFQCDFSSGSKPIWTPNAQTHILLIAEDDVSGLWTHCDTQSLPCNPLLTCPLPPRLLLEPKDWDELPFWFNFIILQSLLLGGLAKVKLLSPDPQFPKNSKQNGSAQPAHSLQNL